MAIAPILMPARGAMLGTPIVGSVQYFIEKYGRAAAHEVAARMPPASRSAIDPHAPTLGFLGTRWYRYGLIGDLVRTMSAVVKADDDTFVRTLAVAGIDASINTAMRMMLRFAVSPAALAARSQEAWNLFHDTGKVTILAVTGSEYVSQVTEWHNHDVMVCRIVTEVRRRLIERTGVRQAVASREKCIAWGHSACMTRIRWV
jgi:hypothetical protein